MMKLLTTLALAAVCIATASTASAQSLEQTLGTAFASGDGGFAALRAAGGAYEGLLTLERLPSGRYLTEVAVKLGDQTLRYPVKLERTQGQWTVYWQPESVYANALAGIAKSGALPPGRSEDRWDDVERMPALGIVATRARFVTPFGPIEPGERTDADPAGGLDHSPTLVEHSQRWIHQTLDDDPAPAGFDLLLDGALDWKALNKIVFNVSSLGLFQVWLVTSNDGALHQVAASAPVGAAVGQGLDEVPVIALYPLEAGKFGFRVTGPAVSTPAAECAPGMRICVAAAEELAEALDGVLDPSARQGMFAATGDVAVADAVALLAALVDFMGLGPHRALLGYIEP